MKTNDELKDLLSQLESFITTKTVVGDPINMNGTILMPVVDVTFGVGAGAKDKNYDKNGLAAAGGGAGAKMSPSAILVIRDGDIRLVNIKNQDSVTKVLDMIPDVLDRVKDGFSREKENKKARETVDAQFETILEDEN